MSHYIAIEGSESLQSALQTFIDKAQNTSHSQAEHFLTVMTLVVEETLQILILDLVADPGIHDTVEKSLNKAIKKLRNTADVSLKRFSGKMSLQQQRDIAIYMQTFELAILLDDNEARTHLAIELDNDHAETLMDFLYRVNNAKPVSSDEACEYLCLITDIIFDALFVTPLEILNVGRILSGAAKLGISASRRKLNKTITSCSGYIDQDNICHVSDYLENFLVEVEFEE